IFVIFKGGDKGERIKSMIFEGHMMRISHDEISVKQMNCLGKHQRRNIPACGLYPDILPPSCKTACSATELQQARHSSIFGDELLHDSFLPYLRTLVSSFIPLFVSIRMFSVEKPFFPALPVLMMLRDKFKIRIFKFHIYSFLSRSTDHGNSNNKKHGNFPFGRIPTLALPKSGRTGIISAEKFQHPVLSNGYEYTTKE